MPFQCQDCVLTWIFSSPQLPCMLGGPYHFADEGLEALREQMTCSKSYLD